jgi:uncharacterized protein (UPF0335 family)
MVKAGGDQAQLVMEKALTTITTAYRVSEKRQIDSNFNSDIKGLIDRAATARQAGKPFTDQELLLAQQQYIRDHDAALEKVDAEITKAMSVVQIAQADRALAAQINTILQSYQDSGFDVNAAKAIIQQVLNTIQLARGGTTP